MQVLGRTAGGWLVAALVGTLLALILPTTAVAGHSKSGKKASAGSGTTNGLPLAAPAEDPGHVTVASLQR